MSYHHHHQFLHSSVLPTMVTMEGRKQRPVSEATSIASSIDFEEPSVYQMSQNRLSKAPTYRYSTYDNMELPEDEEDEEDEEDYGIDDIREEDEDDDHTEDSLYNKAMRMNNWLADGARDSVGSDGMKTASSCDEAKTPTTPPLDFGVTQQMSMKRTTVGPRGPHLFSSLFLQTLPSDDHLEEEEEEEEYLSPISPVRAHASPYAKKSPVGSQHSLLQVPQPLPKQHLTVDVDVNERPVSAMSMALEDVEESEIENWSPQQVCDWMRGLGFEDSLIAKFRQNDISGAILMQLKWEDLKELDIQSFGKRIELWSELNHLRKSPIASGTSPKRELSFETSSVHSPPLLSRHASRKSRESKFRQSPNLSRSPVSFTSSPGPSPIMRSNTVATSRPAHPSPRKHLPILRISTDAASLQPRNNPRLHVSAPAESESEEEIEEVDDFSDHEEDHYSAPAMEEKRRPSGLSIIIPSSSLDIPKPLNSADSKSSRGTSHGQKPKHIPRFVAPHPAKRRVSRRLSTPISPISANIEIFAAPSVLGLTAGKRVSMLECESPRWGNDEVPAERRWAPSICASSDVLSPSDRGDVKLKADELRKVSALSAQEQVNKFITLQHLQRLEERAPSNLRNEIPRESSPVSPKAPPPVRPQPPVSKAVQRSTSLRTFDRHKPRALQLSSEAVAPGPASAGFVPRNTEDIRNYQTPDVAQLPVPVPQAAPPLLRSTTAPSPTTLASQSTPSLVRSNSMMSPQQPQVATLARSNSVAGSTRKGSISNGKKPPSLGKSLIDTVNEEAEWEDTSSHGSAPASPSDRVFTGEMKKRTNHFLRNEWITHRVELRGTKLTVYKSTTGRDVLTMLEIDDYSVTCTSAGSNKFKGLKTGVKKDSDGMYHFQLVPNQDSKKIGDQKKEHHFAVSSREERIDWMRELMLAKAIKQKKSGFQVEVNGKMM
ncbi:hypothetical protein ABW19_dt0201430 [Dactylella cylindrospora]|nr:hypothetical protein ABW19_dt0201430 [Dactylella cylindrospora]